MARNVIEIRQDVPTTPAAVIYRETDKVWWVQCRTPDCSNIVRVSKQTFIFTDHAELNDRTPVIQIDRTAPPARCCSYCTGPVRRTVRA